jgi:hypothetical protein
MRGLIGLVALVLAACAPTTVSNPPPGPAVASPAPQITQASIPQDEGACKVAGGSWHPICLLGKPACVITFMDAGKACRDPSDCSSGRCYAAGGSGAPGPAAGACAQTSDPCGCRAMVVNGQSTGVLCVD